MPLRRASASKARPPAAPRFSRPDRARLSRPALPTETEGPAAASAAPCNVIANLCRQSGRFGRPLCFCVSPRRFPPDARRRLRARRFFACGHVRQASSLPGRSGRQAGRSPVLPFPKRSLPLHGARPAQSPGILAAPALHLTAPSQPLTAKLLTNRPVSSMISLPAHHGKEGMEA